MFAISKIKTNLKSYVEQNAKYIFILLILFYLIQSFLLLDKYILPLDDETSFATTAKSFADDCKIKSDYVIGQEKGVYWQPPFYFIVLGGFFKLFGFGLEQVRIFSIIISVILLGLVFQISRKIFNSNAFAILVIVLIIFDPLFLRFSKIGRMDVLTAVWILSSFYAYLRWLETKRFSQLVVCSIFSLFAVATHPLGLIALISIILHSFFTNNTLQGRLIFYITTLTPILVGTLIAVIYMIQNQSVSFEQIAYQFNRKEDRTVLDSVSSLFARYRVLPGVFSIIMLGFWSFVIIVKRKLLFSSVGIIGVAFIVSFFVIILNFEFYYSLYYLIFTAILCSYLIQNIPRNFIIFFKLLCIFWFFNVTAVNGYFNYFHLVKAKKETDVKLFAQDILRVIPKNANVAIDGYPNLYWTLKDRGDLKIFAPIILSEHRIAEITAATDYLIISSAFRYSEDKEYVNNKVSEISDLFSKNNFKLEMIGNFGKNIDYMCRANLYKVVRDSDDDYKKNHTQY